MKRIVPILRYVNQLVVILIMAISCGSFVCNAFPKEIYASHSRLATGKWVRISIVDDGVYCITKQDLNKWGFKDINSVRVFGYGGKPLSDVLSIQNYIDDLPQTPILRTDKGIVFYGKGPLTWYYTAGSRMSYMHEQHASANEASYFITEDASIPDLLIEKSQATITSETVFTTFVEHILHEEELVSPGQTGRLLVGEDFGSKPVQTFSFNLPDIVNENPVSMRSMFGAKYYTPKGATGGGSVRFYVNGTALPILYSDSIAPATSMSHDHLKMNEGLRQFNIAGDKLDLKLAYQYWGQGTFMSAYLDYIELNYTRKLNLRDNTLQFVCPSPGTYEISGYTSDMRVIDVTDVLKVTELPLTPNGTVARFPVTSNVERTLVAFNVNSNLPSPKFEGNVLPQDLHGADVPDMVIITPIEFLAQANELAQFHEESPDSLNVLVIDQQSIFNEFSSGTPDVVAIRRMLKMYYDRGESDSGHRLKHLLMFGRASYDNRRISRTASTIDYPLLLVWSTKAGDNENNSYCTDDILGKLEDNAGLRFSEDKMSISVGRMPVTSTSEALQCVQKIKNYVADKYPGPWQNNVLVIADDGNSADHMRQSDELISALKSNGGKDLVYGRVYMDAYPAEAGTTASGRIFPGARKDMFEKFAFGNAFASYIGHANPMSWTHDGLLTFDDITNRFNYRHPPVLYTATCEFTRWDANDVSGGECLFLNPRGGAIVMLSTQRSVYIAPNGVLSSRVGRQVFRLDENGKPQCIGDILKNAKNSMTSPSDNQLRYSVIGDPALRLVFPTYKITIDKINGQGVSLQNMPVLKGGSEVTIEGRVVKEQKGEIIEQTDFNGRIYPRMYDSEESITTTGWENDSIVPIERCKYTYYDYRNLLYSGCDSVSNGKYKVKFKLPMEINDNYVHALLNMYACDDQGARFANGSTENVYVYGYEEKEEPDTIGPEIRTFYLNTPSFKNGDKVNDCPLVVASFFDESGINLSSAGLGHNMTLTLDGHTVYDDVVNYYTPLFADGEKSGGEIKYSLDKLTRGNHTLQLKVWDNMRNSSSEEIHFFVDNMVKPEVYSAYAYPNPASVMTTFYVDHNRPECEIAVKFEVFNLNGQLIWSKEEKGRSDMTRYSTTWDLNDFAGRRVSRGIYIYRASISTDGVHATTRSRKIAVTGAQ